MRSIGIFAFALVMLLPASALAADFSVGVTTQNGSFVYLVNGQTNPSLQLVRGHTYTFDVETSGHPFYIKTVAGSGTANQWNEGVASNNTETGIVTFAVPSDAPATLFYQCALHNSMSGMLLISNQVPAAGPLAAGILLLVLAGAGLVVYRRRATGLALS